MKISGKLSKNINNTPKTLKYVLNCHKSQKIQKLAVRIALKCIKLHLNHKNHLKTQIGVNVSKSEPY